MARRDSLLGPVRRRQLLDLLGDRGQVAVSALARELGFSAETIRRDLRALEQTGQLKRVHGGAIERPREMLPPVLHRMDQEARAKAVIAELAAKHVPSGSMVYLAGSSTTLALATQLADTVPTTFVTNMVDIALVLSRDARHEVYISGGQLSGSTRTVVGSETLRFIESRVFELAVFGISAIDPVHGFMGPTEWHGALTSTVRRHSRKLMIVCDRSKFGRMDRYRLFSCAEVDILVTDVRPPAIFTEQLAAGGTLVDFPGGDAQSTTRDQAETRRLNARSIRSQAGRER